MNISNKTVLINRGGSGIGFETARLLSEKGKQGYYYGKEQRKLQKAAAQLKNVTAIPCDINAEADVKNLVKQVQEKFVHLSVLVNNDRSCLCLPVVV